MTPSIQAASLRKRFGRTQAVDGVDLDLGTGVVGLLGPNGAGKTTLLRMLATVLAPDDGALRIGGLDPAHHGDRLAIRRSLGYLPQQPGLYAGFTGFDLVDYVAVLKELRDRDLRRQEVRRALTAVGLEADMHRKLRTLSGGMRQRVALAAALLGDPTFLILDEPAAGLDPESRLQLRSVLSRSGAAGTVVVSTHDTTEVAAYCQRVVVLIDGRVRFSGTPAELAAQADGHVWVDDGGPAAGAVRSWVTPEGTTRHVGSPPDGATLAAPTIDDGYLLLTHAERVA